MVGGQERARTQPSVTVPKQRVRPEAWKEEASG